MSHPIYQAALHHRMYGSCYLCNTTGAHQHADLLPPDAHKRVMVVRVLIQSMHVQAGCTKTCAHLAPVRT